MSLASLALRSLWRFLAPILTLPVFCCLGCHSASNQSAKGSADTTPDIRKATAPPAINVFAVDRSGSTESMRETQKTVVTAGFARAGKWGEKVSIYVVDSKSAEVFAAQTVKRKEDPPPSALEELGTPKNNRGRGTRPALFWAQMASEYAAPKTAGTVRILFLTDGGNDQVEDAPKLTASVKQLAKNPHVYVALVGLDKDEAETLKKQFAPFGERFRYAIGPDASEMLKALSELRKNGVTP